MLLALAFTFPLPQASTMAPKTDALYDFIYWFSVVSFIPTVAGMLYFAWKYKEGRNKEKIPVIEGNPVFEWSVSVVLSVFFLTIFIWGLIGYNEIYDVPPNPYEINVIGQQWLWTFQYANGKTTTNELYVPKGTPVRLILTSKDVIHDFYVPNFRLKQDAVPGLYTSLWFEAPRVGENQVFCAQYCGTAHSNMLAKVVVLEPAAFKVWLDGGNPNKMNLAQIGAHLYQQRNCVACHSIDGTSKAGRGPTLKGVFGHTIKTASGSVTADENYLRDSIVNPMKDIVAGYPAIMPTYKGLLTEDDLNALVAYIKSLKE